MRWVLGLIGTGIDGRSLPGWMIPPIFGQSPCKSGIVLYWLAILVLCRGQCWAPKGGQALPAETHPVGVSCELEWATCWLPSVQPRRQLEAAREGFRLPD